jgi:hypothetical protein
MELHELTWVDKISPEHKHGPIRAGLSSAAKSLSRPSRRSFPTEKARKSQANLPPAMATATRRLLPALFKSLAPGAARGLSTEKSAIAAAVVGSHTAKWMQVPPFRARISGSRSGWVSRCRAPSFLYRCTCSNWSERSSLYAASVRGLRYLRSCVACTGRFYSPINSGRSSCCKGIFFLCSWPSIGSQSLFLYVLWARGLVTPPFVPCYIWKSCLTGVIMCDWIPEFD